MPDREREAYLRGYCPVCWYRRRLRKDGTVQAHVVYVASEPLHCPGSGTAPVEKRPEPSAKKRSR